MEKIGIIIDGYSSGKFYHEYFKSQGVNCLHIQSKLNIPEFVKGCFCTKGYKDSFINENIEQTVKWIQSFGVPQFIIPGCEIGVNLADELCELFDIALRNPLDSSLARRNKYYMQERIKNSGLRSICQNIFDNIENAIEWIESEKIAYPLVVKPVHSTSGDGFHLCKNELDVRNAFKLELNQENLLNIQNTKLLVQEFIEGVEYVIDTVSFQGETTVTDIIKYQKRIGKYGNTVYESCTFMDINNVELKETIKYTKNVLTALQVNNGPAHTEVIVDMQGPVLIEVGARPAGCMLDLDFIRNAYGHNQLELAGLLYASPSNYKIKVKTINNSVLMSSCLILYSLSEKGIVKSIDFSKIEKSKMHIKTDLQISVGSKIDEPKNLSEIHAILYLQGDNQEEINQLAHELIDFPKQFVKLNSIY